MSKLEMIMISAEDKAQVRAILETHAEMQDQRSVQNLELIGRLNIEEANDPDARALVLDLKDQNSTFDDDCDNLYRIAKIFM